jgi:flagellar biosynthesis protein FlhG
MVLADLHIGGAYCHMLFGCMNPLLTLTDFQRRPVEQLREISRALGLHPRLSLIPGTGDTLATANIPYAKKNQLKCFYG